MPRAEQLFFEEDIVQRALELRASGPFMSFAVIAHVMSEYHGVHYSWHWWRHRLRAAGAPPARGPEAADRLHRARAAALAARTAHREVDVDV